VKISLIAAMAENRVIGRGLTMPWQLPEDLRRFRAITWGQTLIMGRKTFESLGGPLPGRTTIVLTRNPDFQPSGCLVARSPEAALGLAGSGTEVFICGGGEIYRQFLTMADRIYLTVIHRKIAGDVFFPEIPDDFLLCSAETVSGPEPHTYRVYEKRPAS
jgi:dihydrofolate reductase